MAPAAISSNNGLNGGLEGITLPIAMTLSAFTAIAWYLTLDLNVSNSSEAAKFTSAYSIMEKIQMTGFSIQELIISALYLHSTKQILKPGALFQKKSYRKLMSHLIYVNILVILMDITLLCTEYMNMYEIQTLFKSAIYAVKLRLEFAILNQLRESLLSSTAPPAYPHSEGTHSSSDGNHISLKTWNRRHGFAQTNDMYSCTASKHGGLPFSGRMGENCVMMTTEVVVQRESERPADPEIRENVAKRARDRTISYASGTLSKPHVMRSPSSSEIEFASKGH
ncbi:hypothetical protein BP5796_03153 [Coleophoma crateriformis]|uniref:DUF7703 domain-containing protein n=1 Tax=Coleophoma crateriformis TaxID=565419 RepID=A0A3D8SM86_9HELO|nr:hypothetical protein BP5796_03153 [Coleophoma crateriformis]